MTDAMLGTCYVDGSEAHICKSSELWPTCWNRGNLIMSGVNKDGYWGEMVIHSQKTVNMLALHCEPPELQGNKFLLSETSGLWHFALAS